MGLGFYCFETIALKLKVRRSAPIGGLDDQDLIAFGQTEVRPRGTGYDFSVYGYGRALHLDPLGFQEGSQSHTFEACDRLVVDSNLHLRAFEG